MIKHTVVLRLHHAAGSDGEKSFFDEVETLRTIPGVENFSVLREVSPKNDFDYCLAMDFADQGAYDNYNVHPDHVAFVENVWMRDVAAFLEIDLAAL